MRSRYRMMAARTSAGPGSNNRKRSARSSAATASSPATSRSARGAIRSIAQPERIAAYFACSPASYAGGIERIEGGVLIGGDYRYPAARKRRGAGAWRRKPGLRSRQGCAGSETSRRRSGSSAGTSRRTCSRKGRAARAQHSAHARDADARAHGRRGLRRRTQIETLGGGADGADLSEAEARAMVRLAKHDRDRSVKLPADLVRALRQQASRSNEAWERARGRRTSPSGSPSSRPCWPSRSSRPRRSPTAATCTTRCSTPTSRA